jgi:molybdopterin-guanine dinucleotide biosynthesis protein A
VIAGGTSQRFGHDKLSARFGTATLLEHAISGLPGDWEVIVVGPERVLPTAVTFVREDPPGSGPAAALAAGAREVCARGGERLVALPGDAPEGGRAAVALAGALSDGRTAVVAVDASGQVQPLQLAVSGEKLRLLAGQDPELMVGFRARRLVELLEPDPVPLPRDLTADIDTPQDAASWQDRNR